MTVGLNNCYRFIAGFFAVITMLFVTGCSSEKTNKSIPTPTPMPKIALITPSPKKNPNAEMMENKTVITYAAAKNETGAAQILVDAYNALSETVYVLLEELPYDDSRRHLSLLQEYNSGSGDYDVFDVNIGWVAEFAQKQFALNLDGYISQDKINMKDYFQNAVNGLTYEGSKWGLPKTVYVGVLYFREDIISKTPKTWDEMITFSEFHKGTNGSKYGFVMNGVDSETLLEIASDFIYSFGGRIIDGNGKPVINDKKTISGLNKLLEIFGSDYVPQRMDKLNDLDVAALFIQGESIYLRGTPNVWRLASNEQSLITGKYAVAQLPSGGGGSASAFGATVMMLNSKSGNADAAWDFMKFAAGTEGQKIIAINGGDAPALISTLSDSEVLAINPLFKSESFKTAIDSSVLFYVTPHYAEISELIRDELELFLKGRQTAEQTVEIIESGIDKILNPPVVTETTSKNK